MGIRIVPFRKEYAPALSQVIRENLLTVNSRDYSLEEMKEMAALFTPENLIDMAKPRTVFAALRDGEPIGTAGLMKSFTGEEGSYFLLTVFVRPDCHRQGVGRALLSTVEQYAAALCARRIVVPSSITARPFYLRLGYTDVGGRPMLDKERHYQMEKRLLASVATLPDARERFERQLAFLIEADKMKSIYRQTLLIDKSRRETDAEHSWHFALAAMLLFEHAYSSEVDLIRVLRMALVHDIVEIDAGDTFAYDDAGNQSKAEREEKAAERLFALLPPDQGREYRALWEEFDAMQTPDAVYAAAIDRLQPFINNLMTQGATWNWGVDSGKVYERMETVKYGLPALWDFVQTEMERAIKKGWLVR